MKAFILKYKALQARGVSYSGARDFASIPALARFRVVSKFIDRTVMTHVVTESCIRCRYTDCVDVCPVDCFREGPNFLAIDPDECIDCAVCVAECPVNAIYAEEDVPADQQEFIKLNVELARAWPSITKTKAPLAEADEWKDVKEKLPFLER
jgi:ferredoxin